MTRSYATTKVNLHCPVCKRTARRFLRRESGSRGVHETCAEPASCPDGHGFMVRDNGKLDPCTASGMPVFS